MKCPTISATKVLSLMVFWGQIQNYMMRISISILIVAMIKPQQPKLPLAAVEEGGQSMNYTEEFCPDPQDGAGSVMAKSVLEKKWVL